MRAIRNGMKVAGMKVESSKGEAWPGQHEINFRYADALKTADDHAIYKNGVKELAHQCGCSVTFMAKPDHTWVGSSCHIHSSLWRDGEAAFAGESDLFKQYLAGQIACARELAIFFAPTINSYKRFAAGSWAPTTLAWGTTTARAASGSSATVVAPPRDADSRRGREPYLASPRCSPRGCTGSSATSSSGRRSRGTRTSPTSSASRTRCARRSRGSRTERSRGSSLGDEVVDHYLNYARTEQGLFDQAVTGYERERLFERG